MTAPSNAGSRSITKGDAWRNSRGSWTRLKSIAQDVRNASASGPINIEKILAMTLTMSVLRPRLISDAALSGIDAYAQSELGDPAFVFSTEANAVIAGIATVLAWVDANIPRDAQGYTQAIEVVGGVGSFTKTYSVGATSSFRTTLDAFIALID